MPDIEIPQGYYSGEVIEAAFDIDNEDEDQPVVGFKVKLDDYEEPTWCWHRLYGQRKTDGTMNRDKTKAIIETYFGSWDAIDTIEESAVGKRVRVVVFHNTTQGGKVYVNAYLVTNSWKRGTADPEKVASARSKLTGKLGSTGLPF